MDNALTTPAAVNPTSAAIVTDQASSELRAGSPRGLRIFELVLVTVIAFGGSLLQSIVVCMGHTADRSSAGPMYWLYFAVQEISALGLLWYVLHRRSLSFRNLGLSWTKKDFAWTTAVLLAGYLCFLVTYWALYLTGLATAEQSLDSEQVASTLFGPKVSLLLLAIMILNPFFEELIARAYIMTEVSQLTGSAAAAIATSTLLQASYHLYQGIPSALSLGAMFLAFSIFYAKTRRITPVILAHLIADVVPFMGYWLSHR